ncbi:MAG: hypothetical protein EBY77_05560, partial [Rhodobacteraceae bacterium]|nr:hypothetical protein [Paracoccaceae bacterium]
QVLKPLIKECIKEAIFEEGVLSGLIKEVVSGLGQPTLVETADPPKQDFSRQHKVELQQEARKDLEATTVSLINIIKKTINRFLIFILEFIEIYNTFPQLTI